MKKKATDINTSRRVIDELGMNALLKISGVTRQTVWRWKQKGFPFYFEMYLKQEYPKLHAWKDEP